MIYSHTLPHPHHAFQGVYSNFIGFDYSHIQDPEQAKWLQEKAEAQFTVSNEEKKNLLQGIVQSVGWVRVTYLIGYLAHISIVFLSKSCCKPYFIILWWISIYLYKNRFEKFLGIKFGHEKRFGVEGCEVIIPGMHVLSINCTLCTNPNSTQGFSAWLAVLQPNTTSRWSSSACPTGQCIERWT